MMHRHALLAIAAAASGILVTACGGGVEVGESGGGQQALVSDIGTTGAFVAYADPTTNAFYPAPMGSYAGKRQVLRGTIDFMTNEDLGQLAGVEVYKGSDGHIYALDLTTIDGPQPQQLSSESTATVDDTCSLNGGQVVGASYAYTGVYFAADLQNPANSSYLYRLPGSGGTCNSTTDIVRMVKTGMSASDAPITVSAMPVATVHTAGGGIAGFVVASGSQLQLVGGNFGNPVVLGTFDSPIETAKALPVGTTSGYPTGQLFEVNGNIVYVDYAGRSVSPTLFTLPAWSDMSAGATFAASPTRLYFAENLPATSGSAATTLVYAMPADGSAAPTLIDQEAGSTQQIAFGVNGSAVVWSVTNGDWSLRTLSEADGTVRTLVTSTMNGGDFTATATNVFYTTWAGTNNSSTHVVTRSGTSSGIVRIDGTVVAAPMAGSMFASGGELQPWPDDSTTTATPYTIVLQIQGLTTVAVTDAATGTAYVMDGVSGGTLVSLDATTGQPIATLGTLPVSNAAFLTVNFRDEGDTGFLEATNWLSTNDPATRDLYIVNTQQSDSLTRITGNL